MHSTYASTVEAEMHVEGFRPYWHMLSRAIIPMVSNVAASDLIGFLSNEYWYE